MKKHTLCQWPFGVGENCCSISSQKNNEWIFVKICWQYRPFYSNKRTFWYKRNSRCYSVVSMSFLLFNLLGNELERLRNKPNLRIIHGRKRPRILLAKKLVRGQKKNDREEGETEKWELLPADSTFWKTPTKTIIHLLVVTCLWGSRRSLFRPKSKKKSLSFSWIVSNARCFIKADM